jgi:nucleotide-binding universal stress UspA family protein
MPAYVVAEMSGAVYLPDTNDPSVYAEAARDVVCHAVTAISADRRSSVDISASIETGSAAAVLAAQARHASILVLGRGHHSTLWRLLSGSVLGAALQHADCPIVIVPPRWSPALEDGRSRVLVAVAEGHDANEAIRWAADEARARGWPFVPVHVRGQAQGTDGRYWPSTSELDEAALRRVPDLPSEFRDAAVPVERTVLVGEPGTELVRYAAVHDLLVVGSRGRGSLSERLLGSTSSYCAQHAACPVVVVRNKN